MDKKEVYKSVSDLYAQYAEPEEKKRFEEHLNSRKLAKALFALRCKSGKTQKEIAEKIGTTQSKISKIEHAKDCDLAIGEILDYCKAIDIQLNIGFTHAGFSLVNKVKFHWFEIQKSIQEIQKISKGDDAMEKAAQSFTLEAAYNISNGLLGCLEHIMAKNTDEDFLTVSVSERDQELTLG